uniref:RRM domain-containing protein n=1 Tax=Cucumis melo TaxID=3656 RepID=A0A9I9CWQ0_CUCME
MEAIRKAIAISSNRRVLPSLFPPPSRLVSFRGIATKLFVGDSGGFVEGNGPFAKSLLFSGPENGREHSIHRTIPYSILETLFLEYSATGLSYYTTDKGLSEAFSQYGQVIEATVVMDRVSDKSKGFGFVTFASIDEAHTALSEMNGKPLNGRVIFVNYAKPTTSTRGSIPIARGPPEEKTDK